MSFPLSEKITLLNQTTLDSFSERDKKNIAANFTRTGLTILQADFGFVWFKNPQHDRYELAYKSQSTPYNPIPPRQGGRNQDVYNTKTLAFVTKAKKIPAQYDVTRHLKSFVIIPVTYQRYQYGNIVLCFKKTRQFSKEDKSICLAIGNAMAQALTINRLYGNLSDFKRTLDNTLDSIFIFDPETLKLQYANNGATLLTGKKRAELLGSYIYEEIDGLSQQDLRDKMAQVIEKDLQHLVFESHIQTKKSNLKIPIEISLQHIAQKNQPKQFLAIVRDITERKESEETIRHMAYYDPLTGLPNRALFNERIRQELDRVENGSGKFAVYFIDLDRFKVINDIYGHQVGDDLLMAVASRLRRALPRKATLCRMGGDEFMVLLPGIKDVKEAENCAKRITDSFIDYFQLEDQEIYVNGSVGLAIFPLDGDDIRTVMKHADLALHRAKEQGGNSYQQYNKALPIFYSMKPQLENELRKAIKNNELVMHYQPVVNVQTRKIAYSEALVRWNHPEMGLLYPDTFISQAEESGLIVDLGDWIINQVSKQIKEWRRDGKKVLPVSINVSPRQLLSSNFVDQIQTIFANHKVKISDVKLELTETFLMKNIDLSVGILEQLKLLGLKILIDDFGTGYASLNYLKRLPIDGVKIDKAFIQGSAENLQDAALTSAIISIAHQLNLEAIAEGVETKSQLAILKEHKCNFAQGNLFFKPMTGKRLAKLLEKKK